MQLISLSTIRDIPVRSSAPQPDSFPRAAKRKSVPPAPKHTHPSLPHAYPRATCAPWESASPAPRSHRFSKTSRTLSLQNTPTVRSTCHATCALVGSILGAELALPWARHCRNFCASREKRPPTSPALTTRRALSFAPQNSGYLSSSLCGSFRATPSFSSAFFKCEPPHGGRTPMSRPKPAAGRLRETGLPQQPQTFLSHSQSPAIVLKTNFDVEAPITSPRNDGFLNINLETWGHRSNSNISTSLFPEVLTFLDSPGV